MDASQELAAWRELASYVMENASKEAISRVCSDGNGIYYRIAKLLGKTVIIKHLTLEVEIENIEIPAHIDPENYESYKAIIMDRDNNIIYCGEISQIVGSTYEIKETN